MTVQLNYVNFYAMGMGNPTEKKQMNGSIFL